MAAEPNRIATPVLAACAALLGLLALAQMAGFGRGYSLPTDVAAPPLAAEVDLHEMLPPLPPLEQFAAIRDRPLFSPERRPEVVQLAADENAAGDGEGEEEPPPPLDVSITGIIITPDVRIAMVRPRGASESLVLREGMPLPGELGAWTLSRVLPRRALFDGGTGAPPAEVELSVDKTVRSAPAPVAAGQAAAAAAAAGEEAAPSDVQSRAAEIRRRIEERRRQMREEAARLSAQESKEE
jgi:general secretion pathway protein N